ncbi:MAG: MarR family transcriptional regulator [Anaerolineae bacterium]|jgi:MarR family 2-MHQ and catechol resistance regulon transcriptional repressor|nr:MarR family transcriptional regulator [Anaerolineae bacterium]
MPVHYKGTPEAQRALEVYVKLSRALNALEARLAEHHAYGDLTASQFGVLEALYHLGPLCQGDLSAKLLKSGGNLTFVVDNLVRLGLVERERDAGDRRRVLVTLTEAGRERIARLFPLHVQNIVAEFSVLSPEEQLTLASLCRKLGKAGQ